MRIVNEEFKSVPVGEIQPHPDNARLGDVDAIANSIDVNGFYGALVVQRSTGFIIVGSHRYIAAVQRDATELPVHYVDVDDVEAKRIMLADNQTSDLAEIDAQLLEELKTALPNLDGTGFDEIVMDAPEVKMPDADEGRYLIAAMPGEKYEYMVVFCTRQSDWIWLKSTMGLKNERSYKSTAVGLGHVLRFADFKKRWDARGQDGGDGSPDTDAVPQENAAGGAESAPQSAVASTDD